MLPPRLRHTAQSVSRLCVSGVTYRKARAGRCGSAEGAAGTQAQAYYLSVPVFPLCIFCHSKAMSGDMSRRVSAKWASCCTGFACVIERAAALSVLPMLYSLAELSPRRLPMKFTTTLVGFCVLALVSLTDAQTKISGTAQCGKPDAQKKVDVPDHPGHEISMSQAKCTWSKPMEVAGLKSKEGVTTDMNDIRGDTAHGHGYYVDTKENGITPEAPES